MFSCEIYDILKNALFTEQLLGTVSAEYWVEVKWSIVLNSIISCSELGGKRNKKVVVSWDTYV